MNGVCQWACERGANSEQHLAFQVELQHLVGVPIAHYQLVVGGEEHAVRVYKRIAAPARQIVAVAVEDQDRRIGHPRHVDASLRIDGNAADYSPLHPGGQLPKGLDYFIYVIAGAEQ